MILAKPRAAILLLHFAAFVTVPAANGTRKLQTM
jgi:hypothetical protein